MTQELPEIVRDWPQFLTAGVLVLMRVSGLLAFAPIFSSSAIAPRIKAGMAFAITLLLAPTVTVAAGARVALDASAILEPGLPAEPRDVVAEPAAAGV